jgi:ParB/RepB/Spo0J family partition protein
VINIKRIQLTEIDPESSINVRRTGVSENVEKVKKSIETHGYWGDQPITLRPHPDENAQYKYEYVTGQCRFKASLDLGLDTIPAFIVELDDDEALRRSWGENEARGDLKPSDQAYWAEVIFKRYEGAGHTMKDALDKTAEWLGVTLQTLHNYYRWAFLPKEVQQMMDQGVLLNKHANAIVKNTFVRGSSTGRAESQRRMVERAQWIIELDRESRDLGAKAMEQLPANAEISELTQHIQKLKAELQRTFEYSVSQDLYENLINYGKQRGISDPVTIISHIIAKELREA